MFASVSLTGISQAILILSFWQMLYMQEGFCEPVSTFITTTQMLRTCSKCFNYRKILFWEHCNSLL